MAKELYTKANSQAETMTPAGYLYKLILPPPAYITAENVIDVYSVGECGSADFSPNFCDYTRLFRHNGFGFFNSPEIMHEIAAAENIDLRQMTLLYLEIYQFECALPETDDSDLVWLPVRSHAGQFPIDVVTPRNKKLIGFDAMHAANISAPDCSFLSCCNLAAKFAVNEHCLFDSFQSAKAAIETGLFHEKEQYPQRLLAVYKVS